MKFLSSCFVVLMYLHLLLALDTSTCGTSKRCIFSVEGCNPEDPTCLIFTYAWSSDTNTFSMELSGSTGGGQYVAVAFSPTGQMETSDMYYCIGTELKSGAIQAFHTPPVTDPTLPSEISDVKSNTTNGVAECTFTRAASVSKDVGTGTEAFDLSTTNYFVLLADGPYAEGNVSYHGPTKRFVTGSFNFTQSLTQSTTPSGGGNEISSGCGTTKGCFTFPSDCTPGVSTCMFASWSYDSSTNVFNLQLVGGTSDGYAAMAFGTTNLMEDADLYYCSSKELSSGVIRVLRNPPTTLELPSDITNIVTGSDGGVVSCTFTRPAAISKVVSSGSNVDFNLVTNDYYVLYAIGKFNIDGTLAFHTNKAVSGSRINFTEVSNSGGSSSSSSIDLVKAHACLMLIAWLTCASIGVIIARHFKPLWHESKCVGEKVWFQLHRSLMITTLLCTIAAFVLIFVAVGGYSNIDSAHPILGIIVTALVIVNPVMAIFRPHPGEPKRQIFNWAHWFVGSLARILAIVAIFLGVDLSRIDLPEWDTWVMVGFVVFHIVTEIILEIVSAYYEHIAVYKRRRSPESIDIDQKTESNPPPRGAAIKYFILIVYTVVNLGFLIAFIVTIADHSG